jgi:hypothetical protein
LTKAYATHNLIIPAPDMNGDFAIAFRGRYYVYNTFRIVHHRTIAANIVNSIPEDPVSYKGGQVHTHSSFTQ